MNDKFYCSLGKILFGSKSRPSQFGDMIAGIAVTWVVMVASQVKVLVVTGTIAQWYFAPAGSSTVGSTKRSLRY